MLFHHNILWKNNKMINKEPIVQNPEIEIEKIL
jgi:hypothetical protein